MQRKQAMGEIFWAIAASGLCAVVSFLYCRANDPRRLFSHYTQIRNDFEMQTWALYYAGFESARNDGAWSYWSKEKTAGDAPSSLIAKSFPAQGYYSSKNKTVIRKHMAELTEAGIDAIIVPWFGHHQDAMAPGRKRSTDKALSKIMGQAESFNIKIGIMIPDYYNRSWATILSDIKDYNSLYSGRSSVLKTLRRPVIFIENAQKLKGSMYTIMKSRRSHLDCYFVGQMNTLQEYIEGVEDGYDALTTFYADEGKSWAANMSNWDELKKELNERAMTLIPAISPGTFTTSRDAGKYYGIRWEKAKSVGNIVFINSFNGWHDGTNIEPALSTSGHKLDDENWSGESPNAFITLTAKWTSSMKAK